MEKMQANLILEILGRPPEHVKEAINTIVIRLGAEKGVNVLNKIYHEPIPVENSKDLFTTFAEIEAEFDSFEQYLAIIFAYMPSNIEIIKPENLNLSNIDLNELSNKLIERLHNYESITKKTVIEKEIALNKLKEIAPESFKEITTPPKNTISKKN